MSLDLENEFEDIKLYIIQQVECLDRTKKVKLIEIGYQLDQGGLVKAYFDCDKSDYEILVEQIGETIKTVMLTLIDSGNFNGMNKFENCVFSVEEINGFYGLPTYEEHGKSNSE